MKKALVLLMLLGLVVGLVFAAGCGDDEKTIDTPFGEVTEEDGEITYESEEGDVTYDYSEEEAPSEDELGTTVYPDAEFVPGTGVVVRSSGTDGDVTLSGAQFTTKTTLRMSWISTPTNWASLSWRKRRQRKRPGYRL